MSFFLAPLRSMTKITGSGSISQRHGSADPDPDPDPYQNVMDPEHCHEPDEMRIINSMNNISVKCTSLFSILPLFKSMDRYRHLSAN
jgi:hypothetical protein